MDAHHSRMLPLLLGKGLACFYCRQDSCTILGRNITFFFLNLKVIYGFRRGVWLTAQQDVDRNG